MHSKATDVSMSAVNCGTMGTHATAVIVELTWKLEDRSCSACSSRTLNISSSLIHAIFNISAAPLLMLRGSSERKNDLHDM